MLRINYRQLLNILEEYNLLCTTMSLGFVYQCFNEDLSLFNCLEGVREHYPDAPIYLMCDNGNDYTTVATHFNCKYVYHLDKVDTHFQKDKVSKETNVHMYLAYLYRMKDALSHLDTDYVLRLEDDVRCTGKIWHIPKFDVIGPFNIYNIFDDVTNHYVNYARGTPFSKENDKIYNYNCGGGAIFKRTSFLEYVEHVIANPQIVEYFYDLNSRNLINEAIADGLGMLFFGYTIGRSFNIADYKADIGPLEKYVTIFHHYKKDYGKKCNMEKLIKISNIKNEPEIKQSPRSKVKNMAKRYEIDTAKKKPL